MALRDSSLPDSSASAFNLGSVPENTEERRAFLQARIALFGKTLAVIDALFLVASALSYFVLAPAPSIALRLWRDRFDLGVIAMWFALWAVTRRGAFARALLELIVDGATVVSCAAFAVMVTTAPEELFILIPALSAATILMARAVLIPSTPRRTLAVALLGAAPSIVVTYLVAMDLGAGTSIPHALGPTIYVACWAGTTVALSTITSRIIYGLEEKVRKARQLGQYTLAERIGAGGMGVVYRANHAMLRRPTAVKVLPPERMGEQNIRRFEREVQLTSQLTHPNTIAIYDYGRTPDGLFYYAMEYLEGFTLTQIVESTGPLPPARAARLMRQIAGSIDEAHRIGLIHRDIKPDNIIVCERGGIYDIAKVLDFGLVKEIRTSDPAASQFDGIVGTPLYMPPEAIHSPATVGVRSDVYALGAVAYFLVTGRHVFNARTLVEICSHHLMTRPEPPSKALQRALPDGLEELILGCLAKAPEERPAGADVLERAFATIAKADPWTQEDARTWWGSHREALTSERQARTASSGTPDRPKVLRSAVMGAEQGPIP